MSGHSKWSTIKRKKGALDQKRGAIFSKLSKEIQTAAKAGGGNPDGNVRLRSAIQSAKSVSMPSDNIEKAIQRGIGQLPGVVYDEILYEGYGPGGVAILIECLTENKNRSASNIRHALDKNGGSLGASGCVAYMFDRKGVIIVDKSKYEEDKIFEEAINAGAEDIETQEDVYEIKTDAGDLTSVSDALQSQEIEVQSQQIAMIAQNLVTPPDKDSRSVMKLLETLEDDDDVQNVHSNFDPSEELLKELEAE